MKGVKLVYFFLVNLLEMTNLNSRFFYYYFGLIQFFSGFFVCLKSYMSLLMCLGCLVSVFKQKNMLKISF